MLISRAITSAIIASLKNRDLVQVAATSGSGLSTLLSGLVERSPFGRGILIRGSLPRAAAELVAASESAALVAVDDADESLFALALGLSATRPADAGGPRFVLGRRRRPAASARPLQTGGRAPAAGAPDDKDYEDDGAGESIALDPLSLFEAGPGSLKKHWFRGGLPGAYFAADDASAMDYLQGYAGRLADELASRRSDGPRRADALALLAAVAAGQGRAFNASAAAVELGATAPTVERFVRRLQALGLIRYLNAWPTAAARSRPRLYLRDQGLAHALLGARSASDAILHGHEAAVSWQAYAVEQAAAAIDARDTLDAPLPASASAPRPELYYAESPDGAALDLILARGGRPLACAVFKRFPSQAAPRGAGNLADRLGVGRRFVVCPEGRPRPLTRGFVELGLARFIELAAGW